MTKFRRIGAGFCGTVWSPPPGDVLSEYAFKREDGGPGRSLRNDFEMHILVLSGLSRLTERLLLSTAYLLPPFQVPYCHRFIANDDEWWRANLDKFPPSYLPCNAIQSQRIPPVPQHVREFLIDMYCPESLIPEIKTSDANKDCLIRPYLGRRRVNTTIDHQNRQRQSKFQAFSLRNFPLHLDQMKEIGVSSSERETYARMMARALALMHWDAEIDANDVEFVIAPPANTDPAHDHPPVISNVLGDHTIWILDFDCCRKMSMDGSGVEQAVKAFLRNDPFYPRPDCCEVMWEAFRDEYLQTSFRIIHTDRNDDHRRGSLPLSFVEGIERSLCLHQSPMANVLGYQV
jgi:hypothetical protein